MGKIVDISHHQGVIDWDAFAKEVDLVIIRVQDGSTLIDRNYQTYVVEAKKRKIPFGHYAFTRFTSIADAKKEAQDFYARGDKDALFWVADVEQKTTDDMVGATQAFVDELRNLGAKKVGAYFSHNGYPAWGLDKVARLDFKWFPRYGKNDGQQHDKPAYPCHVWQYTSVGRVAGIAGNVDLNVLVGDKGIEWFTGIQFNAKGEVEMLDKAIVIGGYPDLGVAEFLANNVKAPIYFRGALPAGKLAKVVYVVGGSADGILADKVVNLSGPDRFAVVRAVEAFLKTL